MGFEMFEKHDKTNKSTLQTALQTYACVCDDFDGTDGGDLDFL